jgi:hypothetical protein
MTDGGGHFSETAEGIPMTSARPASDPGLPPMPPLNSETLAQIRPFASAPLEPLLAGRAVERREITVPLARLDLFGAVVISVDYRLVPEADGTTLVEDCYQGLRHPDLGGRRSGRAPRPGRRLPRLRRAVPAGTDIGSGQANPQRLARPGAERSALSTRAAESAGA